MAEATWVGTKRTHFKDPTLSISQGCYGDDEMKELMQFLTVSGLTNVCTGS